MGFASWNNVFKSSFLICRLNWVNIFINMERKKSTSFNNNFTHYFEGEFKIREFFFRPKVWRNKSSIFFLFFSKFIRNITNRVCIEWTFWKIKFSFKLFDTMTPTNGVHVLRFSKIFKGFFWQVSKIETNGQ